VGAKGRDERIRNMCGISARLLLQCRNKSPRPEYILKRAPEPDSCLASYRSLDPHIKDGSIWEELWLR